MSLDFSLESPPQKGCPHCGHIPGGGTELFSRNITHNLCNMAREAGIYEALWNPNNHGQVRAKDISPILKLGLANLLKRSEHYRQFNAPNAWGVYEHFVPFVRAVLAACEAEPESLVRVSV